MTDTDALYAAVDTITKPSTRPVDRQTEIALALYGYEYATFCSVPAYHALNHKLNAKHGKVYSLWEQAELALVEGAEKAHGRPSPLATRSPADLALMETMSDIRETISLQLQGRKIQPRKTVPEQIRQLATHVAGHEPEHVDWWTFRFEQWKRILETYLQAVEGEVKPIRLRGVACEACGATHVETKVDGEVQLVGAVVIDFRDCYVRAATCSACGWTVWRGDELFEFANRTKDATPVMNIAKTQHADEPAACG